MLRTQALTCALKRTGLHLHTHVHQWRELHTRRTRISKTQHAKPRRDGTATPCERPFGRSYAGGAWDATHSHRRSRQQQHHQGSLRRHTTGALVHKTPRAASVALLAAPHRECASQCAAIHHHHHHRISRRLVVRTVDALPAMLAPRKLPRARIGRGHTQHARQPRREDEGGKTAGRGRRDVCGEESGTGGRHIQARKGSWGAMTSGGAAGAHCA